MTAHDLYQQGDLEQAIQAMNDEVRANPADPDRRSFLADLLCIVGNFDRADLQLDAITKILPKALPTVSLTRQLVRAEQWRQQSFSEGRLPEFVSEPSEHMRLYLRALVEMREDHGAAAAELLAEAEEQRPAFAGTRDGQAFEDFRDCDDACAGFFEVLTSTGKYYWIPTERVSSLSLRPIERPRDLLWRRAGMQVAGGPDGEVYLPLIYTPAPSTDAERMGRVTEWSDSSPVRGRGLRTFLVGEEPLTLLEMEEVEFHGAPA